MTYETKSEVHGSVRELERVDISTTDHTVGLKTGVALGIWCDTAGEVLKIDNDEMSGYTLLPLELGLNLVEVAKIYKTGSVIVGNIDLVRW